MPRPGTAPPGAQGFLGGFEGFWGFWVFGVSVLRLLQTRVLVHRCSTPPRALGEGRGDRDRVVVRDEVLCRLPDVSAEQRRLLPDRCLRDLGQQRDCRRHHLYRHGEGHLTTRTVRRHGLPGLQLLHAVYRKLFPSMVFQKQGEN